jgi:hypothetical protein
MSPLEVGSVAIALTQLVRESFPVYPSSLYKLTCVVFAVIAAVLSSEAWTLPALFQRAGMGCLAGLSATMLYSAGKSVASTKTDVTNPAATDPSPRVS